MRSNNKLVQEFILTCKRCGAFDAPAKNLENLAKLFIRKYTNARIGGDIRNRGHRMAEDKGQRGKGGAGLRDELYFINKNSNPKKRT